MLRDYRVIYSKNGTLSDLSNTLSEFISSSATLDFETSTDYLYLGSDLPFNNRYLYVSTANDQAAILSIEYWTGTAWKAVEDVIDETSVSGVSLAQSGTISWQMPLYETSWNYDDTSRMTSTELSTLNIYNL